MGSASPQELGAETPRESNDGSDEPTEGKRTNMELHQAEGLQIGGDIPKITEDQATMDVSNDAMSSQEQEVEVLNSEEGQPDARVDNMSSWEQQDEESKADNSQPDARIDDMSSREEQDEESKVDDSQPKVSTITTALESDFIAADLKEAVAWDEGEGENVNTVDAGIDTTIAQEQVAEGSKTDDNGLEASTAKTALEVDSILADSSLLVNDRSAADILTKAAEEAQHLVKLAEEERMPSAPDTSVPQIILSDEIRVEDLANEIVMSSPVPEVGEVTSIVDQKDSLTQEGMHLVEGLERGHYVDGCIPDSVIDLEKAVHPALANSIAHTATGTDQDIGLSPLPCSDAEELEVIKQVVPELYDNVSEDELSGSNGDSKSFKGECDGDINTAFTQLHLKSEGGGDSSEESFQEASGLDRDASSSLDSTANTNTSRPAEDALKRHDHPSAVEGVDSSSEEDCVSSKARDIPVSGRQRTKRIDLHHQFVREIVKIQQDRDQYEKQCQAVQQGTTSGSGGNLSDDSPAAHTQAKKRVNDVSAKKQGRRESRVAAQELAPMKEGIAPDTVSMAFGRAPERRGRGPYSGPAMGAPRPSPSSRNKVAVVPQNARDIHERGAGLPIKASRHEDFFQDPPMQRGKETSNRQQRFAPIYRPPNARDTNVDDAEGLQDNLGSGHLAVVLPRPMNPTLPAGIKTPLSPAPQGFSQFRGGLAGGPRATKERGAPSSTPSSSNATPSDRHTRWTESQDNASLLEDSLGLKITIDTANQQRHIEYSKPAPPQGDGDSIVITVSEHGRSSRVVSSPYHAPNLGLGPNRSKQPPDSGTSGSGIMNKGVLLGTAGDAPGFQFKATPHNGNGAGILGKGGAPVSNVDRSKERRTGRNRHKEPAIENKEPAGYVNRETSVVNDETPLNNQEASAASSVDASIPSYKFIPSANSGWDDAPAATSPQKDLVKAVQKLHLGPKRQSTATVDANRDGSKGIVSQPVTDSRPPAVVVAQGSHPVAAHLKWGDMVDSPEVQDTLPQKRNLNKHRGDGNSNVSDVTESTSGSTGYGRGRANNVHVSSWHHGQKHSGSRQSGEPSSRNQSSVGVTQSNPSEPAATVASHLSKKSVWDRLGPSRDPSSTVPHVPVLKNVHTVMSGGSLPVGSQSQDVRMSQPQGHRAPEARPLVLDTHDVAQGPDSFSNGEYGDSSFNRDSKQKRSKFELYVPRRSTPGS